MSSGCGYIDFLIKLLLIPSHRVSALFCSSIPTFNFVHFLNVFRSCLYFFVIKMYVLLLLILYDMATGMVQYNNMIFTNHRA